MPALSWTRRLRPALNWPQFLPPAGRQSKRLASTKSGTFSDGVRWSHDGRAIVFRDSRVGVWRQPVTGEPAQLLKSFAHLTVYDIDWSPDGKQMTYTSGSQVRVVTLVRDFH